MDWLIQQIVDRRWTGPTGAAVEGNLTINSSTKFHNNPSNICPVIIYVEVWTQVLDQGCTDNFIHYTLTTSDLFQTAASANLAVLIESKHDHYFCCVEIWPTFIIFRLGLSRMAVNICQAEFLLSLPQTGVTTQRKRHDRYNSPKAAALQAYSESFKRKLSQCFQEHWRSR